MNAVTGEINTVNTRPMTILLLWKSPVHWQVLPPEEGPFEAADFVLIGP